MANQTVAGDAVIAAIQRRLGDEPVRVKVVCPLSGGDGWVVDDQAARAGAQARLDQLLSALREAGLEAEGEVVASDPYDAVMDRRRVGRPAGRDHHLDAAAHSLGLAAARPRRPRARPHRGAGRAHRRESGGAGAVVSAHAAAAGGHHDGGVVESDTISVYHDSLLRSPVFLGMLMFIGSEIMLFASFFTAFFFIRFSHPHYPFGGFEIPTTPPGSTRRS